MSKLVTIFGGSGFIGRYIVRRLAKDGWRVRVAVRRPNEALFVKPYGAVGQVEPVFCNVRDDASVQSALAGADAVVNCVGILTEAGKNSFAAVQAEAPGRIARIAAAQGISKMVQISALGADAGSESEYARSKAEGEAAVLQHMPDAVILRPSLVFGPEDDFFNRFAGMTRFGPVLPLVGAETKFQPVYVDDVAAAAAMGISGTAQPGVYELGGPDVSSFRALMQEMLGVIRKRRLVMDMPIWQAKLMAGTLDLVETCTFGLISNTTLTKDQIANLGHDNVVSEGANTLETLGITPTSTQAVLPDYLWRFRPSGQYTELKESAKNLKA